MTVLRLKLSVSLGGVFFETFSFSGQLSRVGGKIFKEYGYGHPISRNMCQHCSSVYDDATYANLPTDPDDNWQGLIDEYDGQDPDYDDDDDGQDPDYDDDDDDYDDDDDDEGEWYNDSNDESHGAAPEPLEQDPSDD
jgi:hypothetical protein